MSNEELVAIIQAGENVSENMGLLYKQCKSFIAWTVKKFMNIAPGKFDIDDLLQESYFGLLKAVENYNPENEQKFYYDRYVKAAIYNYIGALYGIGNTVMWRYGKYKKAIAAFFDSNGRLPKDEEIAEILNVSQERIKNLRKLQTVLEDSSLDIDCSEMEDGTLGAYDLIPGDENIEDEVLDRLAKDHVSNLLWLEVDKLPFNQNQVLHLKYQQNLTTPVIADILGYTTYKSVCNAEYTAFSKLRENELIQELAEETGCDCKAAYHDGLRAFKHNRSSKVEYLALKKLTYDEELQVLTPAEKVVYSMRKTGKTIKEIGKELEYSRANISLLMKSANQKLEAYRQQQAEMKEVI